MNPQMQFNLSHIIGQAVDVTNYATFQHQLHGYGNISTIGNISNVASSTPSSEAHSVTLQNVEMPGGHLPTGPGVVAVGYAQQQQTAPIQSYHAVFNSMTVAHVTPQVPTPQVQYFSYEAPCVTLRPQAHSQVPHQVPPQPVNTQGSAKYGNCSLSFQPVNSAVPLSCTLAVQREAAVVAPVKSTEVSQEMKKKRKKEGISAKLNRKARRNRGEAYVNASGKRVEAKQYVEKDCACKSKCILRLGTAADRESIFKQFWNIGNFSQQNAYLTENVTLVPTEGRKRKVPASKVDDKNLKTVKRLYHVRLLHVNKQVRVCKAIFLSLHGVSNGRLDRVLQAVNCEYPYALQDRRGQHRPSNKTSEEDVKYVVEHITSVRQEMEAEFSSSDCGPVQGLIQSQLSTEILEAGKETSVKKMYGSYKKHCKDEGRSPVSLWVYRRIEKNVFSQENSGRISETIPNNDLAYDKASVVRVQCANSENKILTVNHMNVCNNNDITSNNKDLQEVDPDPRNHTLESVTCSEKKSDDGKTLMTREERKAKRNSGSSYYTATGKYRNGKCYIDKECGCKYRCIPDLNTFEDRKQIFADFWKLADFTKQNAYIAEKVVLAPVIQKCGDKVSEKYAKTCSRIYYAQLKGEAVVRVCKMAFLQLHGVSNGRVDRVLQAVACKSPFALQDRRGHHSPKNKTGEEDLNFASSHIRSFLKELSGDDGCDSHRLYLPHDFNIQKMYRLYRETCLQNGRMPVGCFVYRKVLKERYNCYIRSPANKTPEEDLEYAYQHIDSHTNNMPVLHEAVDPQADTRMPLPDASVKKLHKYYIQTCMVEGRKPIGIDVYRKIFNSKFDVKDHRHLKCSSK